MYFFVVNNRDAFNCDHVQYFKCNICFFDVVPFTLIERKINKEKKLLHTTRQLMTMLKSFGFTINYFCYVKNDGTN
jgi:hypothetical protein